MTKRTMNKSVHLTVREQKDLDRFGCTLKGRAGIFRIDWRGKNAQRASEAKTFARLAGVKTKDGPVVVLAFNISLVRPLPQYYYFPFDLKNQVHLKFLTRFIQTGEIKFAFVSGKRLIVHTHQLTPALRSRSAEIYAEILHELEAYGSDKYVFERALAHLESSVRIPELLEYRLDDHDVQELSGRISQAVQVISNENRDLAKRIVGEAANAFSPILEGTWKTSYETTELIKTGFTYINDLRRVFADDIPALTEFLGDAIAASLSRTELEALDEWRKLGVKILNSVSGSATESNPTSSTIVPTPPIGLSGVIQGLAPNRRISQNSLNTLATLLGFEVRGVPGRPTEDYSREFDLKMSGLSWSDLARQMITESSDLRAEFGGVDYDSLDRARQETVTNRIRQGVMGFAKRTGRRLQARTEPGQANPSSGEQKNP
jgi:hypothetical protein